MPAERKETVTRTLLVAFVLCIACSVVVAGAAVALKPMQQSNKTLDRKRNILAAAGMIDAGAHGKAEIEQGFARFDVRLVDLEDGAFAPADVAARPEFAPERFDPVLAAKDPALSRALPTEEDLASIKRRERYTLVYLLRDGDRLDRIVLPIRGYGLWSTLYGYLVLEGDASTVVGLAYYDQKETPGLGGEVDNPKWKALWPGKKVYDAEGRVALGVVKGGVDPADPHAVHKVDGISGATLTSNGVTRMIHYWMGDDGFGPFLASLRGGDGA
jgi:Na+-transporting NADH:ubiquinone oxidoreductase subunit C